MYDLVVEKVMSGIASTPQGGYTQLSEECLESMSQKDLRESTGKHNIRVSTSCCPRWANTQRTAIRRHQDKLGTSVSPSGGGTRMYQRVADKIMGKHNESATGGNESGTGGIESATGGNESATQQPEPEMGICHNERGDSLRQIVQESTPVHAGMTTEELEYRGMEELLEYITANNYI